MGGVAAAALLMALVAGPDAGSGAAPAPPATVADAPAPVVLDLAEVLRRSDRNNPLNAMALAKFRTIEAQVDVARLAWLGKGRWKNDFAIIPVCEDSIQTSDGLQVCRDDLDEVEYFDLQYRPHLRGSFEYGWPLYTFGKIAAGLDAADAGLKAGGHERDATRAEGRLLAKKAYWGALLFRDLSDVTEDGLSKLDKARSQIADSLEEDDEDVDERDAWKLDIFRAEVVSQVEKARAGGRLARSALHEATGIDRAVLVKVVGKLAATDAAVPDLDETFRRALDSNRMVQAARGALKVAQAQEELARAKFWPDLILGVGATYRSTISQTDCLPDLADRTEQCKAADFAPIPVPAIRLEWRIDPAAQISELKKREAKVQVAKADLRALSAKVRLDTEEMWLAVQRGRRVLAARELAVKAAKRLIVAATMDHEAGVGSGKDLSDALKTTAVARAEKLQTVYSLNVAVATLSKLLGQDLENLPAAAPSNSQAPQTTQATP